MEKEVILKLLEDDQDINSKIAGARQLGMPEIPKYDPNVDYAKSYLDKYLAN